MQCGRMVAITPSRADKRGDGLQFFQRELPAHRGALAYPPGSVHPVRLEKNLMELRWHPQLLNEGHILPFVPYAAEVDQEKDPRLETIARIICDCTTVQNAAMALMIHEDWDLTAVYFDGIDHFSHAFMRFHPPAPEWVPKKDSRIYSQVVQSG